MENMKHQSMEREYEMLHKEIETNTADLLKFANIYFPLAITILGFSIKLGESWLSLAVFIFAYIMITSQIRYRKSTFRNAAYCELFLEPHIGRSWEQNLYKMEVLDQYENRNILPRTFNKYKWRFFEWVLIEVVAGFCYFKLQQTMTGEIFISKLDTAVFCIMITLVFVSIVKIIWISNIVARKTEEREK